MLAWERDPMTIKKEALSRDKRSRCDQTCTRDTRSKSQDVYFMSHKVTGDCPITITHFYHTHISTETSYHNQHSLPTIVSRARRIRSPQRERKGAVEGNKNTLCRAFSPLSNLGYCWQHTAPTVHVTIQTADVSLSIRPLHWGKASFAYTMNEMDRYSCWMEEGRKLNEKRTGKGKRERERDNMNPRPDAGLLLHLQTRSSNRQTKPVATLPGWNYYTRDLNNKYVRVSSATEIWMAFKRVHECEFYSIRHALPMLP